MLFRSFSLVKLLLKQAKMMLMNVRWWNVLQALIFLFYVHGLTCHRDIVFGRYFYLSVQIVAVIICRNRNIIFLCWTLSIHTWYSTFFLPFFTFFLTTFHSSFHKFSPSFFVYFYSLFLSFSYLFPFIFIYLPLFFLTFFLSIFFFLYDYLSLNLDCEKKQQVWHETLLFALSLPHPPDHP